MSQREDSLDKHYKPIDFIMKILPSLFWINAVLSIAVFFVSESAAWRDILLYIFILTTFIYFCIDNYLGIFLIPAVEGKRRVHLLAKSFEVPLDNEVTNKYYNNNLAPSMLKLGAHVFENALFSKRITHEMVKKERTKVLILIVFFSIAVLLRKTDIELISILSQTLFASTIFPAYLRLEVLNYKNKATFEYLHEFFLFHSQAKRTDKKLSAKLLDYFVKYESAKAYSGVKLNTKIFNKINKECSLEWEKIKQNLNIDTK